VEVESSFVFYVLYGVLVPCPGCTESLFVHSPSSAGCIARDTTFKGGEQLEAGGVQLRIDRAGVAYHHKHNITTQEGISANNGCR